MTRFALSLLGPVQATLNGQLINHFAYDKVRALLVYLAVEAGTAHARDALAGLLWPELPNAAARTNLRQALTTLRQAVQDSDAHPPVLLVTRETIQFNPACDRHLDVTAFQALVAACATHPHRNAATCTSCAQRRRVAVELYRGDFMAQLYLADSAGFEEWAALTRERLHGQARDALAALAVYYERRTLYGDAQRFARRLVELEPWNEEAHQQVMRVLWLGGQRSAALTHYRRCCELLEAELGTAPTPEMTALYDRIRDNTPSPNADPQREAPPARALSAATTPLLGREAELVHLADLLALRDCRLLTLVGPGGVGKTRLALQLAADLAWAFRDGAVFVALEALIDPALVLGSIAQALDVPAQRGQPLLDQLCAVLRGQELLLVLDNFEQVLPAGAAVVTLLRAAPRLTVLITSRAPLHLHAEQVFPVPPLPTPDLRHLPALHALRTSPAVALFVRRAQAVAPAFQLTPTTAPAVAELCARLDGLPLAIELAAARSTLFAPPALLARLSARFDLLTGGAHDLPQRQQTLRATLDWSYELLSLAEQRLFTRLAVFAGGWTLAAADAVCNAGGNLGIATLDGLQALVEQQLVLPDAGPDGEPRFRRLETIRAYAWERLAASGELDTVQRRHATWFLALAEAAEPHLTSAARRAWLGHLEVEQDNLRAALLWSQRAADGTDTLVRLAGALSWFWYFRDYAGEAAAWYERVVAQLGPAGIASAPPTRAWAKALWGAGRSLDDPHALLAQSVALWRQLGDQRGLACALIDLGRNEAGYVGGGSYAAGRARLEESVALARALGDRWVLGLALGYLGRFAVHHDDDAAAAVAFEAGLESAYQADDDWLIAFHLEGLATVAEPQWKDRAADLFAEAHARYRASGDVVRVATCLFGMARTAAAQGQTTQALAWYRESVQLYSAIGRTAWWYIDMLEELAWLAACDGQPAGWRLAAHLLGTAEAVREATASPVAPYVRATLERHVAAARTQLDAATMATAWAAGRAMTPEQAIAEALDALGDGAGMAAPAAGSAEQTGGGSGERPVTRLTGREVAVLKVVAEGATDQDVAARLGLRPRTVTTYLTRIYAKLDVRTRTAAVRVAREQHVM